MKRKINNLFRVWNNLDHAFILCFVMFLCLMGVLFMPRAVSAGVSAEGGFTIQPASSGTDDLVGATSTSWIFTVTTTEDLVSGDVLRFGFPFISQGYSAFLTQSPTTDVVALYTSMGVNGTNILVNPSFEDGVTSTGWFSQSQGVHEISATTTAYDQSSAVYVMGGAFFPEEGVINSALLASTSTVNTSTPFTLSFYGKAVEADSRVWVGFEGGSCEGGEGNIYRYNFNSDSWDCVANPTFTDHFKIISLTDSFERYVATTTSHADSTVLGVSFGVAKSSLEGSESVILDAVQLEEGFSVTSYNEGYVAPESGVVGRPQNSENGAIVYGFVTDTVPSDSSFSVTISGISNPAKEFSVLDDFVFSYVMGTPTTSTEPWGTLSETKFSQVASSSLVRNEGMPGVIANLLATVSSSSQIDLSWDSDLLADYYVIYSTTTADFEGIFDASDQLVTTTALAYSVIDLAESTKYYFGVAGYNTIGEGPNSVTASSTTLIAPPNAPSGLTAAAASISQINLTWTEVSGATSYKIYRSTDSYTTAIATTSGPSYSNTGLSTATTYSYKVSAVNVGGEGEKSSAASATTNSASTGGGGGGGWFNIIPSVVVPDIMIATSSSSVSPALQASVIFKTKIKFGDKGEEVRQLQAVLKELGYYKSTKTNAIFNAATRRALLTYQRANKIKATGILDDATRLKLNGGKKVEAVSPVAVDQKITKTFKFTKFLNVGSVGEEVRNLQEVLKDLGYFSVNVTGYFGPVTKAAVIKLQQDRKIAPAPGWVGPATRETLNSL